MSYNKPGSHPHPILIIPCDEESYVIPSVADAVKTLGIKGSTIYKAIMAGTALNHAGRKLFVDYLVTDLDSDTSSEKEACNNKYKPKYELIAQSDGKVYKFSGRVHIAYFIRRSPWFVNKYLKDGYVFKSQDGDFYTVRVIA